MKKSKNKIVKILAKSKSWNLFKIRFRNLSKFKKVQSIVTIKKLNFFTLNTRLAFTKLG